ncbi:DMT family transporter [Mucilaginibacter antarcticus]|uniref:Guanidinium exporter n=1 Tax=Mucilaginibacter antarcticus TaxID=1855725 RepID=A0ABW5XLR6_9SPHI
MAWIYIIIASVLQAAWTYSVKSFSLDDLKLLNWANFYTLQSIIYMAPITGYIVFGAANAWFFSMAIKDIPTAMAFAAWTGGSIICIKLAGVIFYKEPTNWPELFFMLMIMGGVMGLKFVAAPQV